MFKETKNIDAAFRYIRVFSIAFITGCTILSLFIAYKSYELVAHSQQKIFTRDVAKQSADNSLQLMELTSVDPSLKAQAAAKGISTVKSLLNKKVKQVKVLVKAECKVLLKSKNLQQ